MKTDKVECEKYERKHIMGAYKRKMRQFIDDASNG